MSETPEPETAPVKTFDELIDAFAITVVRDYRRFLTARGNTSLDPQLYGCAPFANNLAKCNYEQKKIKASRPEGAPVEEGAEDPCRLRRNHFSLCIGNVFCEDEARRLIRCVTASASNTSAQIEKNCPADFSHFNTCLKYNLALYSD